MAEQGDFEQLMGGQVKEAGEMSDEQFRDQMRQTQAALRQFRQEETQVRVQDLTLAKTLVHFLSQPQNTDLFLLVSRAVGCDLPSEIILAVISLIDPTAEQQVGKLLAAGAPAPHQAGSPALILPAQGTLAGLSPEVRAALEAWIGRIRAVGRKKARRFLETALVKTRPGGDYALLHEETREIQPVLLQLASIVLRNFLERYERSPAMQELYDFMSQVFLGMLADLEEELKNRPVLKAA